MCIKMAPETGVGWVRVCPQHAQRVGPADTPPDLVERGVRKMVAYCDLRHSTAQRRDLGTVSSQVAASKGIAVLLPAKMGFYDALAPAAAALSPPARACRVLRQG